MTVTLQHQFNAAWEDLVQLASANNFFFSDSDEDGAMIKITTPNVKCGRK